MGGHYRVRTQQALAYSIVNQIICYHPTATLLLSTVLRFASKLTKSFTRVALSDRLSVTPISLAKIPRNIRNLAWLEYFYRSSVESVRSFDRKFVRKNASLCNDSMELVVSTRASRGKKGRRREGEKKRIGVSESWTNTGWARRIKRALPIYPSKGTINV